MTVRRASWMVFLVALAMRLGFIAVTHPYRIVDGTEEVSIAHALAERNTFADPYKAPSGPTAHSSPAYPFILSLVYRAFGGETTTAELVKEVLSTFIASLQFALLPALAAACGLPLGTGLVAGLLGAILPLHTYLEVKGEWTAPYGGVILLLLAWMMIRSWRRPTWRLAEGFWRGAAFGVALWFSPVFLPVFLAWLAAELLLVRSGGARELWRAVALCCAVMAVLQVPWTIRNAVQLGSWVWSRSSLPLSAENAFADYAKPGFLATLENIERTGATFTHPNSSMAELNRVRQLGEVAYNAEKQRRAIDWIRAHPGRAVELVAARTVLFWFPLDGGPVRAAGQFAITVAAWCGWWLLRRRNRVVFIVLGLIWLAYPPVYYIVASDSRYVYPIFWSKLFASGIAMWFLAFRSLSGGGRGPSAVSA